MSEFPGWKSVWAARVLGSVLILIALPLLIGGGQLLLIGGSPYYGLAGIGLGASGLLTVRRRAEGAWLYGAVFILTILWALWEAGFDFWPLVPRLVAPAVLAVPMLLLSPRLLRYGRQAAPASLAYPLAGAVALGLIAAAVHGMTPHDLVAAAGVAPPRGSPKLAAASAAAVNEDWRAYGRTGAGTRFAPFDQINKSNVGGLKVAWTYRMGPLPKLPGYQVGEEQNTPIQAGNSVYVCNAVNVVFALDADTGKQRWRFDPKANSPIQARCRGLAFYEAPAATAAEAGSCPRRVIVNTIDSRMFALDVDTGKPCRDFGNKGWIDLKIGMGKVRPGFYQTNSAPTVVRNLVVIGGWVIDNEEIDLPSGVIRAFDARTGELAWAWDMARPDRPGLPPEGETYTRSTPNMWGHPAFDDRLGLIYIPTGNASPDFYGARRSRVADEHTSAVVALDIATGREKWVFRTVNHDTWDYDVAAQPALYDVPDGRGGTTPALAQATKRGQIFLLDRRTGKPIATVVEKPVPTHGALPGERLSPTQPYSTGMPAIGTEMLTEAKMWGATPFDQLWCRIQFKQMRYEGEFTPQSTKEILIWPGFLGGFNWGSTSIDERRGYLIVTDIRLGLRQRMVPRAEADPILKRLHTQMGAHIAFRPNHHVPWAVKQEIFLSPLGIPCNQPPWGTFSAIDLKTRKLVWQVPAGTIEDTGPLGLKTHVPVPIGMPTLGGPLSTKSGLIFYAGTRDYYLRALDVATGKELWKGRLPVGVQATPMSYVSPASGRQFIAVVAGGARYSPDTGDYVIAYALPRSR